jgi:hypothetical protein
MGEKKNPVEVIAKPTITCFPVATRTFFSSVGGRWCPVSGSCMSLRTAHARLQLHLLTTIVVIFTFAHPTSELLDRLLFN